LEWHIDQETFSETLSGWLAFPIDMRP
jgi:hypothetical protein